MKEEQVPGSEAGSGLGFGTGQWQLLWWCRKYLKKQIAACMWEARG